MECEVRSTTTVGQLKQQVSDKTAWPVNSIILNFGGATLSNPDCNLNSLDLGKDPIMRARLRGLMGGMMGGAGLTVCLLYHTHTHTHTQTHTDTHRHTQTHTDTHTASTGSTHPLGFWGLALKAASSVKYSMT